MVITIVRQILLPENVNTLEGRAMKNAYQSANSNVYEEK